MAASTIRSRRPWASDPSVGRSEDISGNRIGWTPAAQHGGKAAKKNPRDLRLAGSRSLQPPSAPRAQVLRATSHSRLGFLAVGPFVGLWGVPSLPARTASWPSQPYDQVRPVRLTAFPGVPASVP